MLDRLQELVERARAILGSSPDRAALWRAYVAVEYAILDLKLRHNLEHETPPQTRAKKNQDLLPLVRSKLQQLDPSSGDKKALLYELRVCRDLLKALVADHDRRSTTS